MASQNNDFQGVSKLKSEKMIRIRSIALAIFIVVASGVSFHGSQDQFIRGEVKSTTVETVGIFALVAGLKGTVAVAQTTEIKIPMVEISLGEILEPVADVLDVAFYLVIGAVGSLILQQVIVDFTASTVFKHLVLWTGLFAILTLLPSISSQIRDRIALLFGFSSESVSRFCKGVIRFFTILVVIRFVVPFFVVAGILISESLLQSQLDSNSEALKQTSQSVDYGTDTLTDPDELAQLEKDSRSEREVLVNSKENIEIEIDQTTQTIKNLKDNPKISEYEDKLDHLKQQIKDVEKQIDVVDENLRCIEKQKAGEGCEITLKSEQEEIAAILHFNNRSDLGELETKKTGIENQIAQTAEKIENVESKRDEGIAGFIPEILGGAASDPSLTEFKDDRDDLKRQLKNVEKQIDVAHDNRHCIEKQKAGDSCEFWLKSGYQENSAKLGIFFQSKLEGLDYKKADIENQIDQTTKTIENLKNNPELTVLADRRDALKKELKNVEKQIDVVDDDLLCIEKQKAGESCESWLKTKFKEMSEKTEELLRKANDLMVNTLQMMLAVTLKNVLFPVLFLYLAIKCSQTILRRAVPVLEDVKDTIPFGDKIDDRVSRLKSGSKNRAPEPLENPDSESGSQSPDRIG